MRRVQKWIEIRDVLAFFLRKIIFSSFSHANRPYGPLSRHASAFAHAHERLQLDKAFVISIVRVNADLLSYIPQVLRTDKEVCLAAKAYWAGQGDALPHCEGLLRQGLLWEVGERAKIAAQAVRGRPT